MLKPSSQKVRSLYSALGIPPFNVTCTFREEDIWGGGGGRGVADVFRSTRKELS